MSLFTPATEIEEDDYQCVSAWALPKSGKSTFYLGNERAGVESWPLPLYIINHDLSVKELLPKTSLKVRQNTYIIDVAYKKVMPSLAEAKALLEKAESAAEEAIIEIVNNNYQGTIVTDTATQHWQLVQAAMADEFDKRSEKMQRLAYGPMNARFHNYLNLMKVAKVNSVFIHHASERYIGGTPQNTFYQHGQSDMDAMVQTKIQLWVQRIPVTGGTKTVHGGTIQFCRYNDDLAELPIENLDYPKLYSMTFGREYKPR